MDAKQISLIIMGVLYIMAGLNHFNMPRFYIKITPPYIPAPKAVNIISGLIEIVLGVLLFIPAYSALSAWGIIALLIAVFPANIYHYQLLNKKGKGIIGLVRLPIQGLFILWAYWHTYA